MLYRSNYVCAWSCAIAAFVTGVVLLVLGFVYAGDSLRVAAASVFIPVGLCVSIVACSLRTERRRVLVRGGRFLFAGLDDAVPSEREDVIAAINNVKGKPPVVVGAGWGFFLKQKVASRPRIFMHRYRGMVDDNPMRWKSGTPLREVSETLSRLDPSLAFDSHPSLDSVSIGGAYSMGNHGNGGDRNGGFSKSMLSANVIDMKTRKQESLDVKELRRRFDNADTASRTLILDVTLDYNALVMNTNVQKEIVWVEDAATASIWIAPGAYLRVLFVGHARSDRAMGLRWVEPDGNHDHVDPHLCSTFCMSLQADVCSAVCNCCIEPDRKWTGLISRREANRFSPTGFFSPIVYIVLLLSGTRNYEIVFGVPEGGLRGDWLWSLISRLGKMHRSSGGRSEIRASSTRANAPVFVDLSLSRDFHKPCLLLYELGVKRVALHPGKMIVETDPITRVSLGELYGLASGPEAVL